MKGFEGFQVASWTLAVITLLITSQEDDLDHCKCNGPISLSAVRVTLDLRFAKVPTFVQVLFDQFLLFTCLFVCLFACLFVCFQDEQLTGYALSTLLCCHIHWSKSVLWSWDHLKLYRWPFRILFVQVSSLSTWTYKLRLFMNIIL